MGNWFLFAALTFFMFGLWGFFSKLSTNYIDPKSAMVYEVLGRILIAILILILLRFRPEFHIRGISFAFLTGVTGTLGVLFFLFAVSQGRTSVVVTMTALYPLVTILLTYFILKEPITLKQAAGMLFALIAMILFAV